MPGSGPPPPSVDPMRNSPGNPPPWNFDVAGYAAILGQEHLNEIARNQRDQSWMGIQAMQQRIASEAAYVRQAMTPPPVIRREPVTRYATPPPVSWREPVIGIPSIPLVPSFRQPAPQPVRYYVGLVARGSRFGWSVACDDHSEAIKQARRNAGLTDAGRVEALAADISGPGKLALRECECGRIWFCVYPTYDNDCAHCGYVYDTRRRTILEIHPNPLRVAGVDLGTGLRMRSSAHSGSWTRMPLKTPQRKRGVPKPPHPPGRESVPLPAFNSIDQGREKLAWAFVIGLLIIFILAAI
jgi:hypothetical protein